MLFFAGVPDCLTDRVDVAGQGGFIGAALAGFLLSPLLGTPTINSGDFSVGALLISLLGAVILLAIVNLFRRGRAR